MAFIARRTFASAPTTDVYFGCVKNINGYVRTLAIGSQWSVIRVGIQYALRTDGTNDLAASFMVLAINSGNGGNTYPFGATSVNSYFGQPMGDTLVYNAGGGEPYYSSTRSWTGKKIGATLTLGSPDTTDSFHPTVTGTQRRGIMYVDFDKTAGTTGLWTFSTASHVQVDYSEAVFVGQLSVSTPAPSGNTMHMTGFNGNGVTDTGGALDTLSMYYSADVAEILELYDLQVYRFI